MWLTRNRKNKIKQKSTKTTNIDEAGMQNARDGVLYLWKDVNFKSPLAETFIGGAMSTVSGILDTQEINLAEFDLGVEITSLGIDSVQTKKTLWDSIKNWAQNFMNKLWVRVKEIFGEITEMAITLKSLALFVTQQIFSKASPFIGAANELVQGLSSTTGALCDKIGNWLARRNVVLNSGHPQTLVDAIEVGLTRALLNGLRQTVQGAVSLALHVSSFGGAAILDCVVATIEAVTKFMWRIAESHILKKFISDAKAMWQISKISTNGVDPFLFNKWLRDATEKVPVIAAITLNSGIAGDKMRLIQMYSPGEYIFDRYQPSTSSSNTGKLIYKKTPSKLISQAQFDASCNYIDRIKRSGSKLIERSGLKFSSDDVLVNGLLTMCSSHAEVYSQSGGGGSRFLHGIGKVIVS